MSYSFSKGLLSINELNGTADINIDAFGAEFQKVNGEAKSKEVISGKLYDIKYTFNGTPLRSISYTGCSGMFVYCSKSTKIGLIINVNSAETYIRIKEKLQSCLEEALKEFSKDKFTTPMISEEFYDEEKGRTYPKSTMLVLAKEKSNYIMVPLLICNEDGSKSYLLSEDDLTLGILKSMLKKDKFNCINFMRRVHQIEVRDDNVESLAPKLKGKLVPLPVDEDTVTKILKSYEVVKFTETLGKVFMADDDKNITNSCYVVDAILTPRVSLSEDIDRDTDAMYEMIVASRNKPANANINIEVDYTLADPNSL